MVRVAVVGLGAVARNIQLPAYAALRDRVQLVGGCDPDESARALARERWNLPAVFDDLRTLIANTKPDIVSICTPPSLHRDHAILALKAGCHVFCEKPIAENLEQADEIIETSEETGRRVVINNQFPYMRINTEAKKLIGTPKFGRLLHLHAWQTFTPTESTEAGWRGKLQRRLCFEFGIHVFELVRFFFDQNPVSVIAHMPKPERDKNFDVINIVSMEFADGRAASMFLNRASRGPEHYLELQLDGEVASISTSIGGRVEFTVGVHTQKRRPFMSWSFAAGGEAVLQVGNDSKIIAREGRNPFATATAVHFANFLDAINSGSAAPGEANDNRNTLALVSAAYESAQLGRAISLESLRRPQMRQSHI